MRMTGITSIPNTEQIMFVFSCVVLVLSRTVSGNPVICQQPDHPTLHKQWVRLNHPQNITQLTAQIDRIPRKTCPSTLPDGPNVPDKDRSLCPWDYEVKYDASRYPAIINEAYCLCPNCIFNNINACVGVYYDMPVLRQTTKCQNGVYIYEETTERVSVGCTCTKPRSVAAQPITEDMPDF